MTDREPLSADARFLLWLFVIIASCSVGQEVAVRIGVPCEVEREATTSGSIGHE